MIKVGSMVQSEYTHNGTKGNIGLVLEVRDTGPANYQSAPNVIARVFYPKTRTSGWVSVKDMKVIA